ncbi:Transcriptional activator protein LuxR [Roseivivax sp. THAF40]|uniref:LuxR family transcriptional regulator n=1 Tax=unclassified Roseivivax TaxID=2639302 RepID=UPI001268896E|nr:MULTISPECIES: LuxR family transcriptional regulator [unclassified Roseivivax]QFS82973.1 Transcriptional activator protein LuxR [Roseivivax sp. THAF197b]QFT46744.1 Transcriptional activator protein LuxR [Roseivivax sp. THAF40]
MDCINVKATLDPVDPVDLQKRVLALTQHEKIEEVWADLCDAMARYGFDRLFYGFTQFRSGQSLGDPDDFLVLTNHPPSYTQAFFDDQYYRDAPMVRWALNHDGACSWNVLKQMEDEGVLSAAERRVLMFNRARNVTAGYSVSFRSVSRRAKGAIALTARIGLDQDAVDAIWEAHSDTILILCNVAHLKILTLPYTPPNQSLTRRQREALEWVGDGKTTADTAALMGLTPATVEKHLRLARAALNVETTAQAVLKASFQNQMFVLDL